jgi:hypothetical protein
MRPNKIKTVKAKKALFLLPNYKALTWKGIVYCAKKEDVESINKTNEIDSDLKSHETIHVRQAESMNNSWFRFYIRYIWDWLKNFTLIFVNIHAAYKFIATEMEAYLNQEDYSYVNKGCVYQWKDFEKIKLKEKRKWAKEYYSKDNYKTFTQFLRDKLNKD